MYKRSMITIWFVVLLLAGGALLGACGGKTPASAPATTAAVPTQAAATSAPATAVPTGAKAPATPAPTDELSTQTPAEPTTTPVTEETPAIAAAALLQARCVDCHSLSRTTGARYTQAEWQAVVTRMIKHGAALNPDEEAALVAYLAETYKP